MTARAAGIGIRLLAVALLMLSGATRAQISSRAVRGVDVQKLADGVLGVIGYTVTPDVTTSSLSLANTATSSPGLTMTQLGGGFTFSKDTPLYLEGNAAYARYNPSFLASDGATERAVPANWNSFSATGGIGWDFAIADYWAVRPIFNFTLGYVASDLAIAKWWLSNNTAIDLNFLDGGKLNAYGLGGSLMLVYEKFAPEADDNLELRVTSVELKSYDGSAAAVVGHAESNSASVWARRRVPTGWGMVWDRPLRYVFEAAHTEYFGAQRELGISRMSSVGFGLELDSSAYDIWATRWRAVVRYKFGPDVTGWALGLAISF
ncbi:MAG TPA: hypothetical protein VMG60_05200 [Burkholderiaceae bacterium]|nr:hypothetical protein [Burkholderiaceae bacterium]